MHLPDHNTRYKIEKPDLIGLIICLILAPLFPLIGSYLDLSDMSFELIYWAITFGILLLVYFTKKDKLYWIGFKKPGKSGIFYALVLVTVIFLLIPLLRTVLPFFGFEIESPLSEGISEIPPWLLVYFALRAAITEEILYRAYPIEVFLYVFQKKWIAYLIPVLIFTLAHGDWDIFNFILIFTAGSIFAWVYIVKRNLWINIIAHFAVNIIGFFILPLFMS